MKVEISLIEDREISVNVETSLMKVESSLNEGRAQFE